jgi:spore maturation protein CgeD
MKASIIITSFNRPHLLPQAVESALMQDYDDKEILIGDDGSILEVRELCEKYEKENGIIYYQSNRADKDRLKCTEYAENINECIKLSTGDVIFYLVDDDYYLQGHVSEIMAAFEKHPDWMLAYAPQRQSKYNDDTGVEWNVFTRAPGDVVPQAACQLDHNQVAHRRAVIDKVGLWETGIEHRGAADAVMWNKVNVYWPVYKATDKITNVHRWHRDSIQGCIVWP